MRYQASKTEPLGWRPGLDGLRGVAVLAVLLYHFGATNEWFPGGSLGVDIFFVLSGFLITTLLLEERERGGSISLAGFYRRRARRLLPAIFAFLAVFAVVTVVTRQPGADRLPATLLTAALYVFNWLDDFGGAGVPGAGHLWSLSVEEQFYVVWPLVVILALRARPGVLFAVSLAVFVASASLPFTTGRDYSHLYSGTEFRSQELMAGAILAQLRCAGAITPSIVQRPSFRALLVLSVAFYALFIVQMENRVAFLEAGLYTGAAVCGAVIVCAVLYAPPRILTHAITRYVGTRSYALYLWHHAFAWWFRDWGGAEGLVVGVALSFAAAELSWQLVERPIWWKSVRNWLRQRARAEPGGGARPPVPVAPSPEPAD